VVRTPASIGLALLMVLGFTFALPADVRSADRFTFVRPPAPESTVDPKDRLSFNIERWSTDAERDRMLAAIAENGQEKLLDAFRETPDAGRLQWPGGLQYAVRYAHRIARTDGGSDIVLVVDRPLWLWWESQPASTSYPYTVLQLRLDKDGKGEGRASFGVAVSSDKTLGVVLSDYPEAPALLTDIRRQSADS
jgi:hypothetical protein